MKLLSVIIFLSLRVYRISTKLAHKIKWKNKVISLIKTKGSKKLTKNQKQRIKSFYLNFKLHNIDCSWHRFYLSCNNRFFEDYVPENLFYIEMEPYFNRSSFVDTLADKNLLERLFPNVSQPVTVIKNINGFFYKDGELITKSEAMKFCETKEELVIKPTLDSGGGKNVVLFKCSKGITNYNDHSLKKLFDAYRKDFIVQKLVEQHPKMKLLNSSSVNTFRVMSYLTENGVDILSIIVRMGKTGSRTDNSATGGLSCGVNFDGTLKDVGFQNKTGDSFAETEAGTRFSDIQIPFIDKIIQSICVLHKRVPYFKLISWDLAIDDRDNLVLIEYNIKGQEINFHQLSNGPVLKPVLVDWSRSKHLA